MKRLAAVTALLALLLLASTASAASISGTYRATVGSKPLGGALKGTWTVKFSHGNYKVSKGSTVVVRGTYTVSGSTLTMNDKTGSAACPRTGKYAFKSTTGGVTLTRIRDGSAACAGRAAVLTRQFRRIA